MSEIRKTNMQKCIICDGMFDQSKGSLNRHMNNVHNIPYQRQRERSTDTVSEKTDERSTDANSMKETKTTAQIPTSYLHGALDPIISTTITLAVQEILKKLDSYTMNDLSEMVKEKFPIIPYGVVSLVVKASVEAAWYVSKTFHVIECYRQSADSKDISLVQKSKESMLAWFSGMRPERNVDDTLSLSGNEIVNKGNVSGSIDGSGDHLRQ